eukprot:CAMPEP_0203675896 /NCGR_PEP_ID=MMETSP0090-20130426/22582_1 /ASSEMBLY_ACC=CAM_ASM_001088 /TAXON_ID=426623 /ORGANISM="Chaetoceros affinis, Strain CCMP159" /LENGTH=417 /DNA_ID=CAMNT_0050542257 /DNA_START=486 /DNA_END=1739 /DNA_ORIENTATION=+
MTRTVGSDAGALPKPRMFNNNNNKEAQASVPQSCIANMKTPSGQCLIPRGGASASAAAAATATSVTSPAEVVESLRLVGLTTALISIRNTLSSSLSTFWSNAERTKFLLAGAVAGIVSRTCVSPLEVVATAQMVRGGNKNMVSELTELFHSEGIKGFFKGNGANCLKVAPTRGVQFFAFETFKKKLVSWKKASLNLPEDAEMSLSPIERLVAGGFAGMIASSMVYPIEVVKTMLTMYPGKYAGINAAFRGVLNEVGPKGLYAGLAPTLIAMFPYVGVEFMIYETSKIAIETLFQQRAEEAIGKENGSASASANASASAEFALPIIISLGLGAVAGAAAQTSAHPLDVIRKRLQVQGINGNPVLYKTTFDCFAGVAKKEGMGALYKGLGPACVATIPGTGIAYITYEFMKRFLNISSV